MSKHTPGPWESTDIVLDSRSFDEPSSQVVLVRARRGDIAYAAHHLTNGDPTEQHANAKLIAAAPQMLDALKEVKHWLEGWASAEAELDFVNRIIAKATA
jgi:hypothetical protein